MDTDTDTPQLLKDALGLRALEDGKELWFAAAHQEFATAVRLHEAGRLDRAEWNGDTVWRASDAAQAALEASFTAASALN